MKKSLSRIFKGTALAVVMGLATPAFADDAIIAIVDDGVVLKSELERGVELFSEQLQAQQQTLPPAHFLQDQVLEQLIIRQIQKNLVQRYGVRISEDELNQTLLNIAKQSGFDSLNAFQKDLDHKKANSYAALRTSMAEDLAINRLTQQILLSRIKISDQDVNNFIRSPAGQATLGSKFNLLHMRVSGENALSVAEQVKIKLENGQDVQSIAKQLSTATTIVQGTDLGWKHLPDIQPELAVRASSLQAGEVSDNINGLDGSIHLVKVVDRKAGVEKNIVQQYETRHILIRPSLIVSPENAQQMIQHLYQRAVAGEDFTTLASTFSSDAGTARYGGSLGWVNLGTMVPEFEAVMKQTPVGQVSLPFQTQYGWHILQVTDVREYDRAEEYKQDVARQILGDRQFEMQHEDWLREIRAGAFVEILNNP